MDCVVYIHSQHLTSHAFFINNYYVSFSLVCVVIYSSEMTSFGQETGIRDPT